MAIHLISGVPGAGKSLRAVWTVTNLISGKDQDRPVFGNVRGYKRQSPLPGSEIHQLEGPSDVTPGEWMDCPDGSIILIDEVQQRWRRSRATGEPPPEIAALEMHRHRNIDFVLTCQNPSQLNADVRALVDVHEHLTKRSKGVASVWKWEGHCETTPHRHKNAADCEVSVWKYPKWVFDEYVSAVEHNVKKKIPRSVKILIASLVAIPCGIAFAAFQVNSNLNPASHASASELPVRPSGASTIEINGKVPVNTVEARAGVLNGDECHLYDDRARRIDVSWVDCMNAMSAGLPQRVSIVNL